MTGDPEKDVFDKIEKYIKGEADDNEKNYVESLLSEGGDNRYLRDRLREDWELIRKSGLKPDADLDKLLDRIHHVIRKKESLERRPLRRVLQLYMKAAAVLILPLLIGGGLLVSYLSGRYNQIVKEQSHNIIYAPMGSRVSFNLPDGTTGVLNSGSVLSYSLPFSKARKIDLEGEAWFDVTKDENNPFEIRAGSSQIKVLGTSFNVSAYPAENYVEVVLESGSVEFTSIGDRRSITMSPSERLVFRDGHVEMAPADPEKYNAWVKGRLVFRGDSMPEVARRIERWYNIKVVIADKELEKYSFRATFEDDNLEDVLRFLAMTSPIRYKISPRAQLSDGTYSKEVVTVYKK